MAGKELSENNIRAAREARSLTQEKAARELGIAPSSYSRYEKGERECSYSSLRLLSALFRVSVDYLIANKVTPDVVISEKEKTFLDHFRAISKRDQETLEIMLQRFYEDIQPHVVGKKEIS